jgi:hypothetical protein
MTVAYLSALLLVSACGAKQSQRDGRSCDCGFRTIVYSKPFGDRFKLPPQGVRDLDQGLQAVALRVYEDAGVGYHCELDLYLNSGLGLALKAGATGLYMPRTDPLFFVGDVQPRDARYADMLADQADHILFVSEGGLSNGGAPKRYVRDVFDGIDLVTFEPSCGALDPTSGKSTLWIKRQGAAAPLDLRDPSPKLAFAFKIPDDLLRHALAATRRADRADHSDSIRTLSLFSIPPSSETEPEAR